MENEATQICRLRRVKPCLLPDYGEVGNFSKLLIELFVFRALSNEKNETAHFFSQCVDNKAGHNR
jgi:hypothetical protein